MLKYAIFTYSWHSYPGFPILKFCLLFRFRSCFKRPSTLNFELWTFLLQPMKYPQYVNIQNWERVLISQYVNFRNGTRGFDRDQGFLYHTGSPISEDSCLLLLASSATIASRVAFPWSYLAYIAHSRQVANNLRSTLPMKSSSCCCCTSL